MNQHKIGAAFALVLALMLGGGALLLGAPGGAPLFEAVRARGVAGTAARNLVAGIYLDYRLFDTLLEALLLLISVLAVTQFSILAGSERNHPDVNRRPDARRHAPSHVMTRSLWPVYLLIALFGVYVVVTGMDGPGGGFQGGAVLAAIVISAHFAEGRRLLGDRTLERIEKLMYALILIVGAAFLLGGAHWGYGLRRAYLLVMNGLIGLKVFSGLSMIYFRFMAGDTEEDA